MAETRDETELQGPAAASDEAARRAAQAYLEEVSRDFAGQAELTPHVLSGHDEFSVLEDLVDSRHVDLVVVSAHGHSGGRGRVHGNLTTSFLLHGGAPLLILQDLQWQEVQPSAAQRALGDAPPPHLLPERHHEPGQRPIEAPVEPEAFRLDDRS